MKANSRLPLHYLFLLPDSATPADQEAVAKAARDLVSVGYVYVASATEQTMEDREGIRYLPLRENSLPHFGAVAGVMVVRDQKLAHAAQELYPGAKVALFDPTPTEPQRRHEWRLASSRPVHSLRIPALKRRSTVPDAA
jgi:hypothetical protein